MLLSLTLKELCYIDDCITLEAEGEGNSGLRPIGSGAKAVVSRNTIEKVGGALLESYKHFTVTRNNDYLVSLEMTEQEIILLRELADSSVRVGEELVGLNLKIKFHTALQEFFVRDIVGSQEKGIENNDTLTKNEIREKMQSFLENSDGGKDANSYPN